MNVQLPIEPLLPTLIAAICTHRRAVVVAAPGAGKTTLLPDALARHLKHNKQGQSGQVIVTQPRRVATRAAAKRVAALRGEIMGQSVGYQVRFDTCVSPETNLVFVTEGLFLKQLAANPKLLGMSCVVLDEFHGRTRELDLILGIALCAKKQNQDFPIFVVMSATLDAPRLAKEIGGPILDVPGRPHPVEISYFPRPGGHRLENHVAQAIGQILSDKSDDSGDILVFLPGKKEIERAIIQTSGLLARHNIDGVALHGGLSAQAQDLILEPAAKRRCIFSTNLAETSVTLKSVTTVIDSGLARALFSDPTAGISGLRVIDVDKAALAQRTGRAGRVRAGRCIRLFTRLSESRRPEFQTPELLRLDLAEPALLLAAAKLPSLLHLPLLDKPSEALCLRAERELIALGAFSKESTATLSSLGRALAALPLHPRIGRFAVSLSEQGHLAYAAKAAALLSEGLPTEHDSNRSTYELADSDLAASMTTVASLSRESQLIVQDLATKLKHLCSEKRTEHSRAPLPEALSQACFDAFSDRVAKRLPPLGPRPGPLALQMAHGGRAVLSANSCARSGDFVVPLRARTLGPKMPIEIEWAHTITADELFVFGGDRIREHQEVLYDPRTDRVTAAAQIHYEGLLLHEDTNAKVPEELLSKILVEAMRKLVASQGLSALLKEDDLKRLRGRLALVSDAGIGRDEEPLLDDDEAIWKLVAKLANTFPSRRALHDAGLVSYLERSLSPETQTALLRFAPLKIAIGRKKIMLPVAYAPGQDPQISARLQVFLGLRETPTIGPHKKKIVLHLLGPNFRTLQVTQDLTRFWQEHYPKLRPALMRRYPRHAWPEDPLSP